MSTEREKLRALYAEGVRSGMEKAAELARPTCICREDIWHAREEEQREAAAFFDDEWGADPHESDWEVLRDVAHLSSTAAPESPSDAVRCAASVYGVGTRARNELLELADAHDAAAPSEEVTAPVGEVRDAIARVINDVLSEESGDTIPWGKLTERQRDGARKFADRILAMRPSSAAPSGGVEREREALREIRDMGCELELESGIRCATFSPLDPCRSCIAAAALPYESVALPKPGEATG